MSNAALSSTRSSHGNQLGAPDGCDATMTPSVSSSQPTVPQRLRSGAGGDRRGRRDRQLVGRLPVLRAAPRVEAHARDAQLRREVERQLLQILRGVRADRRGAGEAVGGDPVVEVELVARHPVPGVAVPGEIRVAHPAAFAW
jgi:hypothetical protein